MGGYAASARLSAGSVRNRVPGRPLEPPPSWLGSVDEPADVVAIQDDDRLDQWLADAREAWAQTTFFLFNEDGWG